MTAHNSFVFTFDDFMVREREYLLVRAGQPLPVEPKAFRVLLFLLRNQGRLLRKDEILRAVWDDCSVSDNSLTRSIATLRRLLGDDHREPRYIATVQKIGYRFLGNVTAKEDVAAVGTVSPGLTSQVENQSEREVARVGADRAEDAARTPANLLFVGVGVAMLVLFASRFFDGRRTDPAQR